MPPLISVVMSVYNGEQYLCEAIESILNQTFKDFEFIIINDGSTDETLKIIKSYKDPRIVLINRKNKGLITSLNEGVKKARGKYIARQDADDISVPDRFMKQLDYLGSHPGTVMVCSKVGIIGRSVGKYHKFPMNQIPTDYLKSSLFELNPIPHGSVMMLADAVRKVGAYSKKWELVEDYELWSRLALEGDFAKLKQKLYLYRVNEEGVSLRNADMQANKVRLLHKVLRKERATQLIDPSGCVDSEVKKSLIRHYAFRRPVLALKIVFLKTTAKVKKILVVSLSDSYGGGEEYIRILSELGTPSVRLLLLKKKKLSISGRFEKLIDIPYGDLLDRYQWKGAYRFRLICFFILFRLLQLRYGFDAIHLHQFDIAVINALPNKVRKILTLHTNLDQLNPLYASVNRRSLDRLDVIIAVAKKVAGDILKLGISSEKIIVIPNTINSPELSLLRLERQRSEVVWVGRIEHEDKNPKLFIDVAKQFNGLSNLKFVMYGDGGARRELEQVAKDFGLSKLSFGGFVENKLSIYKKAKLLLLTSEREAMPLCVIEALAAGVPVVSTEVGDVRDMLQSGAGVIVEGTPESFRKAVLSIVENDTVYNRFCGAARSRYTQGYMPAGTIKRMEQIYV